MFSISNNSIINGIIINVINNDPQSKLDIEMVVDNQTLNYEVPHIIDVDNDYMGITTSVFKTYFKPFQTNNEILITINTKITYNDQIKINLIEQPRPQPQPLNQPQQQLQSF